MPNNKNKNVYIFLDESGKPEVFSSKGMNLVEKGYATKFLVISAIRTVDQLLLQQQVVDFRAKLLKDKTLIEKFSASYTLDPLHANNDYPEVREMFYKFIASLDVKINVLVAEKMKCFHALQMNSGMMYGIMAGELLKDICHKADMTEIIFSRKDSKLKLREALEQEVGRVRLKFFRSHPNLDQKFKLSYHHNHHYTHGGLQVADYVAYAVFQVFERGKRKHYEIIKDKIGSMRDVCNKKYFTRSNPL